MIKRLALLIAGFLVIGLPSFIFSETFVVKKKKAPSANKLKQEYADELATIVRDIPQLQKQLAELQEQLIDELDDLINNEIQTSKCELDSRVSKARDLRSFLEDEYASTLSAKSSFVKKKILPEKT